MFEPAQESTTLTMLFARDGGIMIKEDISMPGTSSSNTLGGKKLHRLKKNFYLTQNAQDIAQQFNEASRGSILEKGILADFIEKARTHDIYTGKN